VKLEVSYGSFKGSLSSLGANRSEERAGEVAGSADVIPLYFSLRLLMGGLLEC
jgi:hypothetical protein